MISLQVLSPNPRHFRKRTFFLSLFSACSIPLLTHHTDTHVSKKQTDDAAEIKKIAEEAVKKAQEEIDKIKQEASTEIDRATYIEDDLFAWTRAACDFPRC